MTRIRFYLVMLLSCSTLVLAGCESDEDKAERFYQSALALLEQDDTERALVELRNVFNHDGFHKEARMLYADKVMELGRPTEAYGQYLRLIEQYPDTVDARVALAQLATASNDWAEAERHGAAAVELAPDRPDVQAIDISLKYRQAALDRDDKKRADTAADAARVLKETRAADMPDNAALVRVVIDNLIQGKEIEQALVAVNDALERTPLVEDLNLLKVRLLAETENVEGTGKQLQKMVDLFPENMQIKQALIRWYLSQNDVAGAEAFLRAQAGDDTAEAQGHLPVIQLLEATQGSAAARAELDRLRVVNEGTANGRLYAAMIASMDFQTADRDKAIADMRAVVDASEDGPQKIRVQVMLAQMLLSNGAQDEAYALVGTVLENDASNVTALQMRAAQLIDEDKSGEAIVALRTALGQNPRDPDTLTLMARAHERDGDTDLMGERLALAMEASGNAVPEVLRYANFLANNDRQQVAVTVLVDARRRNPGNIQLIGALASLHLQGGDWQQARSVVQELRDMNTPQSLQAATELEARILQGQNRTDDSLALLQEQLDNQTDASAGQKTRAISLIVQTQIRGGKLDAARVTLDEALAETPDNPDLRLLSAALYAASEDFEKSETVYRALMEEFPQSELPVRMLVNLLSSTNRPDDARAVLEKALAAQPDQPNLMWMQAGFLERAGDIDAAIAIYEKLYDENSSSLVAANNLASLITTHRDDPDSLARAANIVRRLRGTKVPAFQDTYGWIAYRRENYDEALEYLEPAAKGLPNDMLVQYHLGMTYAALGRNADAKTQLEKALEIAGDSPLPQFDRARETLAGLE